MASVPELLSGSKIGHRKCQLGGRTEMLVCIDLTDRGFYPYRAIGQHAPYDVIAADGERLLRIECRSGIYNRNTGHLSFDNKKGDGKCDLFAVWNPHDASINYFTAAMEPADPMADNAVLPDRAREY